MPLFAGLVIFGPDRNAYTITFLCALGLFQVLEPKLPLASVRGSIMILHREAGPVLLAYRPNRRDCEQLLLGVVPAGNLSGHQLRTSREPLLPAWLLVALISRSGSG